MLIGAMLTMSVYGITTLQASLSASTLITCDPEVRLDVLLLYLLPKRQSLAEAFGE